MVPPLPPIGDPLRRPAGHKTMVIGQVFRQGRPAACVQTAMECYALVVVIDLNRSTGSHYRYFLAKAPPGYAVIMVIGGNPDMVGVWHLLDLVLAIFEGFGGQWLQGGFVDGLPQIMPRYF